jgi:hypothetical protein
MNVIRCTRRVIAARVTLPAALLSCVLLFAMAGSASALDVNDTSGPVTGNATWFSGLGGPYGGCGMTQDALETQDFVALNVYNTPGDYTDFYQRPMPDSLASSFGMWNNGHNCGRWVKVTIGDYCTGVNDGAQNQPFCRNGDWQTDAYNDATLNMLVADSCGDGNAWCRDDPYHLDLAQPALNRFVKDGSPVGDMYPDHWNNRHVSWQFIPAPDYAGDIQIGFLQSAQPYWPALAISHLPNGIHGVDYWADGAWQPATMDGDMGQAYIVGPIGSSTYQIRVRDANDELLNGGRVYTVSLPGSCGTSCGQAYTQVSYTTSTEPSSSTGGEPSNPTGSCTATASVTNSWPGGYQAIITVTNSATSATTGWRAGLTLPEGQGIRSYWSATVTQTGQQVTATSLAYNSALAPSTSTSWGMIVDGDGMVPSTLTCAAW